MDKQSKDKETHKKTPDQIETPKNSKGAAENETEATGEKMIPEAQHLRVLAAFENYKKRLDQQLLMCGNMANKRLIKRLLPVLSEMELALAQTGADEDVKGFAFIHKKIVQALGEEGLAPIQANQGDTFNPDYHEAISSRPGKAEEKEKIAQVVSKGYTFNGEVIAFTKVIVNT